MQDLRSFLDIEVEIDNILGVKMMYEGDVAELGRVELGKREENGPSVSVDMFFVPFEFVVCPSYSQITMLRIKGQDDLRFQVPILKRIKVETRCRHGHSFFGDLERSLE